MTTGDAPSDRDRAAAEYDRLEAFLRGIIDRPHYRVRRGKVVTDENGEPVTDPRPARNAQSELNGVLAERKRLLGE